MHTTQKNRAKRLTLIVLGLPFAAVGLYVAFAAFLTRSVAAAPLFPQPQEVPSVVAATPPPPYAAAVDRARALVRAAISEQNLSGVSVAAAAGGTVVWAEGFGWRDVASRAPVTPDTRFNIGTAASAIDQSVAPLGLTDTGTDPIADWSPSHLGEPEDDFPLFTLIRDVIVRPLGFDPARPLPGNRATFYVPRTDHNPARGRREMYMRDMACCGDRMAFYSTPSDLVRFALATDAGRVDGALAGGMVMSLMTQRDSGIALAVTSNVAYTNTSSLAERVAEAFGAPAR